MQDITKFLRTISFPGGILGFHYIAMAIDITAQNQFAVLSIIKSVYVTVAEEFDTSPNCVERDIRTAIAKFVNNGGIERVSRLTGYTFDAHPTVKDFIDLLSDYIRRQG